MRRTLFFIENDQYHLPKSSSSPQASARGTEGVLSEAREGFGEWAFAGETIPRDALAKVLRYAPNGSWGNRTAIPHLRFAPAGGSPWPDASQVPPDSRPSPPRPSPPMAVDRRPEAAVIGDRSSEIGTSGSAAPELRVHGRWFIVHNSMTVDR